jgi:hypothetical protein
VKPSREEATPSPGFAVAASSSALPDPTASLALLRGLLETQRFAVLSTRHRDGHPYASLVAFRVDAELRQLVFCTRRSTRKFANLEAEGRVALLIDDRSNDEAALQQAAAVTVLGACVEAHGAEREALSGWFLQRHPAMSAFVQSEDCAVIKVEVHVFTLVTRFQELIEFHLV